MAHLKGCKASRVTIQGEIVVACARQQAPIGAHVCWSAHELQIVCGHERGDAEANLAFIDSAAEVPTQRFEPTNLGGNTLRRFVII